MIGIVARMKCATVLKYFQRLIRLLNIYTYINTCEIKCRIAMAKAAFNKKRALFTSTLELELRKKLVKCYIGA